MTRLSCKLRASMITLMGSVVIFLSNSSNAQLPNDVIKIGVIVPLTGSTGQWGFSTKEGAVLAVEEVNSHGGIKSKKLELVVVDDQCSSAKGIKETQELIKSVKPIAILGAVCSGVTLAIAPLADKHGVVLISPASTSPAITNSGNYIFRVIPSDQLRAKVFAEYIYSQTHKRVSVLYIDNDGGRGSQLAFVESFTKLGGQIVLSEAYPENAQTVEPQWKKVIHQTPDAVVIISYPMDTPIVLKNARDIKVEIPLFFQTEALDDPKVFEQTGDTSEGITFIIPSPPTGTQVERFKKKFKQKYGKAPGTFAAEAYDVVMLIAHVVRTSTEITSEALRIGLENIDNFSGASGAIAFDENGDVVKPMSIIRISNGVKEVVKN